MVYYLTPNTHRLNVSMESVKSDYRVAGIPAAFFFVIIAAIYFMKPKMFCDVDATGKVVCVNKLKTFVAGLLAAAAGLAVVKYGIPDAPSA